MPIWCIEIRAQGSDPWGMPKTLVFLEKPMVFHGFRGWRAPLGLSQTLVFLEKPMVFYKFSVWGAPLGLAGWLSWLAGAQSDRRLAG